MFRRHIVKKNIKNQYSISTTDHTSDNIFTSSISNHNGDDLNISVDAPAVIKINNQTFPASSGNNNQILSTNGSGVLSWVNNISGELINDTSPQLSGNLDLNNRDITGTGNINITGSIQSSSSIICSDLTVNGNTTHINTSTLTVDDPLIYLGENNSANTIDLGWYGNFNDGSVKYAGMIRDATDGKFKIFTTSTEPTTTVSNITLANIECGAISSSTITSINSSVSSNTSSITTLNTSVTNNTSNISTNSTNIINHSTIINNNTSNISTNTSNISTNTSNISTNTSNISTNTGKWSINGSELYRLSNVGIGTNNPTNLLDIRANNDSLIEAFKVRNNSSGSSSGVSQVITTNGSGDAFSRYYAGNHFSVGVDNSINSLKLVEGNGLDGVKGITIDTDGNVGIGTDNPAHKLSVAGNIQIYGEHDIEFTKTTDDTSLATISSKEHGLVIEELRGSVRCRYTLGDGAHIWYCGANTEERVRLDQNGNLGIGTNNPAERLHIKGDHGIIRTEGTNSSGDFHSGIDIIPQSRIRARGIRIRNGTTDNMRWLIGNKYNSSHDHLNFLYTDTGEGTNAGNYTEFMTIKKDGNVGIGTTNPAEKIHIYENSSTDYLQARFENANSSGGRAGIQLKNGTHTLNLQQNNGYGILENYGTGGMNFYQKGTGSYYFKTTDSNTDRMYIGNDGKVGIGRTNPAYLLDVNGSLRTNDSVYLYQDIFLGSGNNERFRIHSRQSSSGDFLSIVPDNSSGGWEWGKGITLKRDGKVGIGRTNPSFLLDVNGNCRVDDTLQVYSSGEGIQLGNHEIKLTNSGVAHYSIVNDDSGFLDFRNTSSSETLGTSGTSLMSITSGGNLEVSGSSFSNNFNTNTTAYAANQNNFVLSMSTNNSTEVRRFSLKHKSDSLGVFRLGVDYLGSTSGSYEEFFSIVGNGKVGIGTNNPAYKFHIRGTQSSVGDGGHLVFTTDQDTHPCFQQLNWTHDNIAQSFDAYYNGAWRMGDTGSTNSCCQWYKISDKLQLRYGYDTQQGNTVTWNNGIIVNLKNGNVGIGAEPVQKLDVYGNAFIGEAGERWRLGNVGYGNWAGLCHSNLSGSSYALLQHSSGGTLLNCASNQYIGFRCNNSEKMRMKADGKVGIGTTNPSYKLHVYGGDIKCDDFYTSKFEVISNRIQTHHNENLYVNSALNTVFETDGTERMTLLNNGNFGIGLNNPSQKLEVVGNIKATGVFLGGESGAVVKIKCLEWSNGADCNSSSWTDSQTLGYTKKVGTNLIITSAFDYQLNGYGSDHFESRLKVSDDANTYVDDYGRSVRQHFDNHSGGGSRSNTLNAIMVQTAQSFVNRTNVYITLQLRKSGADDYMNIYEGFFLVHEVIA